MRNPNDVLMIDIPLLNECRDKLGWSQLRLAEESGIDRRTVERIYEKGYASRTTHAKMLNAVTRGLDGLGKAPKTLVLQATAESRGTPNWSAEGVHVVVETGCQSIEIHIGGEIDKFTAADRAKVLSKVAEIIGRKPPGPMGSIRMKLDLRPEEAERLLWAIKSGELCDERVLDAELGESDQFDSLCDATDRPPWLRDERDESP